MLLSDTDLQQLCCMRWTRVAGCQSVVWLHGGAARLSEPKYLASLPSLLGSLSMGRTYIETPSIPDILQDARDE